MPIEEDFRDAADRATKLPKRPPNDVLLQLYSLYKQGTEGDVSGTRPGFADFEGRAKYDAWNKLQGCLLYTSPSPRDLSTSRMPSSA